MITIATDHISKRDLEEIIERISKKLMDEFLKTVLITLTQAIIDLKEQVAKLAEGQKALQEQVAKLAEGQKALQEQVAKLAEGQKALQEQVAKLAADLDRLTKEHLKTRRALRRLIVSHRKLLEEFRIFRGWIEDLFGRWSHFVGAGAEAIIREIFRSISESKKTYKLDGIEIPPLRELKPIRRKRDGYQFDLSGVDPQGNVWLIEVKVRAIADENTVSRMLKSVRRWVEDHPKTKFVYLIIALGGIERGLDELIVKSINSIGGKAIILDRFQSLKLLRNFGYPV